MTPFMKVKLHENIMLLQKRCQTIVPQFELRNSAGDMIIVPDTLLFLEVVFFTSLRAVSMPSKKNHGETKTTNSAY